jgi:hypothetical protein
MNKHEVQGFLDQESINYRIELQSSDSEIWRTEAGVSINMNLNPSSINSFYLSFSS